MLFTRDNDALKRQLAKFSAHWPNMTPEWFESRARIWLHYAVVKLGRGNSSKRWGCCLSSGNKCWDRCCFVAPIYRNAAFVE